MKSKSFWGEYQKVFIYTPIFLTIYDFQQELYYSSDLNIDSIHITNHTNNTEK